jgi:hypothetical protein
MHGGAICRRFFVLVSFMSSNNWQQQLQLLAAKSLK